MSKTIKLEDQVYQDLDALRGKRETFSQAANRLIRLHTDVNKLVNTLSTERKET